VKVAWVTHHVGAGDPADGWLPGEHRGGGEMTDADWRAAAPGRVTVDVLGPDAWREATVGYDRIVVTGTDLLSEQALRSLAKLRPVVALHHRQTRSAGRQALLEAAGAVILHTPAHEAVEREWAALKRVVHVLSPMRLDEFPPQAAERRQVALWAARNHPLKGQGLAAGYAARKGWPFMALTGQPRSVVLEAMAEARWFVHLPLEFESEGRSVIEAVLSGCEVAANRNVGVTSHERWRDVGWMAEQTAAAGDRFWEVVCGSA
jgi:hypothetical protein